MGMQKKKKRNNFPIFILLLLLPPALVLFLYSKTTGADFFEMLTIRNLWLFICMLDGILIAFVLSHMKTDVKEIAKEESELEDTKWLSDGELKKLDEFTLTNGRKIRHVKDGTIIFSKKHLGKLKICLTSSLHSLIVGTTGSGKTTGFVDQNISLLSKTKTKPSLVITDPKMELLNRHKLSLEKEGYTIRVMNLREPYSSSHWNPMQRLVMKIEKLKSLELMHLENGKYYGGGEVFLSYRQGRCRYDEIQDELFEDAKDLIYTLCPIRNKDQPSWEEGARNLILAILLAFVEDVLSGKMDESKLTLFNLKENISKYSKEDLTVLRHYLLEERPEFSKVPALASSVLVTQDRTLTSYLSDVHGYMQMLSDDGMNYLTSKNDYNLSKLDKTPTAFFLVIPDEKKTRHPYASLFISQLYKELVDIAKENKRMGLTNDVTLQRNVYFILDEFGNLPKINGIDNMMTVARSRGIRFLLVLQSFSQLKTIYGRDISEIIKSSCNVKIFIGSDDYETRREFSELCGRERISSVSHSTSGGSPSSSSVSVSSRPLISESMLERINGKTKGDAIVSIRGFEPIYAKFTPSFELKKYYFPGGQTVFLGNPEPERFQKELLFYDLNQKNSNLDERILDRLQFEDSKREAEYKMKLQKELARLDLTFDNLKTQIDKIVASLQTLLEPDEYRALCSCEYENILLAIDAISTRTKSMEKRDRLLGASTVISNILVELQKLQNMDSYLDFEK